jgi:SAM-dependent methyltransferase
MKPEEIVPFFEARAKDYDHAVFQDRDYIAFSKIPLWMIPALKTGKKILDLGCGTGLSSAEFFKCGCAVTGIDITPGMIFEAQKHPFERLICQSLEEELPVETQEFDAAILLGVMEFIHRPLALFAEVRRALKKEGLFGLTIPQKLSPSQEKQLDIFTYEEKASQQLFAEAGFRVVYREEFPGFTSAGIEVRYDGYLLEPHHLVYTQIH